jgi:hypothetical protein
LNISKDSSPPTRIEFPDFDNEWIVYYTESHDPYGMNTCSAQDGKGLRLGEFDLGLRGWRDQVPCQQEGIFCTGSQRKTGDRHLNVVDFTLSWKASQKLDQSDCAHLSKGSQNFPDSGFLLEVDEGAGILLRDA